MSEPDANGGAQRLVDALAEPAHREEALRELGALGPAAREAVRAGLGDGRWEIRRGCVLWLLRHPRAEDLSALLPLLRDPRSKVRHAAALAIAIAHGAGRESEVVPPLVERALHDESPRVRRQAVALLAWQLPSSDLEGFFAGLLESERDPSLLRFARMGVHRCRERAARSDPEGSRC